MPTLREWMLHFPADWTPAQAHGYCQDVTLMLVNTSLPIMHAVGPERACACLMTAVLNIVRANPVYHEDIKNVLASVYDLIDGMDPFAAKGKPS
jgi:hypothetical protein